MEKVARIFSSFSAPRIYTERSAVKRKSADHHEFIAVALFSGIGLLISLVAIILGIQGVWF